MNITITASRHHQVSRDAPGTNRRTREHKNDYSIPLYEDFHPYVLRGYRRKPVHKGGERIGNLLQKRPNVLEHMGTPEDEGKTASG